MILSEIKSHIYKGTKTNSTSFPAADMVVSINNAIEYVESVIRTFISNYDFTRFTTTDLSTGTAAPKFRSLFHEIIPLWVALDYAGENVLQSKNPKAQKIALIERNMRMWYGLRKYRVATVTIAAPSVWTLDDHGLNTNDRVIIEASGTLPTGFTAETWYYVIPVTMHTFKLAATRDGSAITGTGSQTGTHFVGTEKQGRVRRNYDSNR